MIVTGYLLSSSRPHVAALLTNETVLQGAVGPRRQAPRGKTMQQNAGNNNCMTESSKPNLDENAKVGVKLSK